MVFVKHNSLKSYIFFNPIFIPGFSESRFFRIQVIQDPGSGPRARVQVLEVAKICFILGNIFFHKNMVGENSPPSRFLKEKRRSAKSDISKVLFPDIGKINNRPRKKS